MAELSSGNGDKNVSRTGSFKILGRSPGRSLSKKTSNPFSRIFSRKKSGKQDVSDAERDPSSTGVDSGMIEENAPTILQEVEEFVPQVIEEVVRNVNIETLVQDMTNANPIAESKESIPAILETDAKKPELLNKVMEVAVQAKDEILEKAKEGGLEEVYKVVAPKQNAPTDQPLDDGKLQERSIANIDEVKGPSLVQRLQDEAVAVAGVVMAARSPEKQETSQGETQGKVEQEDNCVASLAQGLQKICAQWNNKKED